MTSICKSTGDHSDREMILIFPENWQSQMLCENPDITGYEGHLSISPSEPFMALLHYFHYTTPSVGGDNRCLTALHVRQMDMSAGYQ